MEKLNLDEHVDVLLEGVEGVTEEQKQKVETVLEAAVKSIIADEKAKIDETVTQKVEESVTNQLTTLEAGIKSYLDYVVTEWVEDNKLEIERGSKVTMAESLFSGLKGLMSEHNVVLPEGKEDALALAESEVERLKTDLNESKAKSIELETELNSRDRAIVVSEATKGLTDTQKEKFSTMIEGVEASTNESYAKKIGIIRESYFNVSETPAEELNENNNTETLTEEQKRLNKIRFPYNH